MIKTRQRRALKNTHMYSSSFLTHPLSACFALTLYDQTLHTVVFNTAKTRTLLPSHDAGRNLIEPCPT